MPPGTDTLVQIVWAGGTAGLIGFMLLIIWWFMTGRIVRGSEMEEWREVALQGRDLTGTSVSVTRDLVREETLMKATDERVERLEELLQFVLDEAKKKKG